MPSFRSSPANAWGGSELLPVAVIVGAGGISAALLGSSFSDPVLAVIFMSVVVAAAAVAVPAWRRKVTPATTAGMDWSLVAAMLDGDEAAVAVTDRQGHLICTNNSYAHAFPGLPKPSVLPIGDDAAVRIEAVGRLAQREGEAQIEGVDTRDGMIDLKVKRAGLRDDYLIWRFEHHSFRANRVAELQRQINGAGGRELTSAGVMAVLIDAGGRTLSANALFRRRALGDIDGDATGYALADLLRDDDEERVRLAREPDDAEPVRIVTIPLDETEPPGATLCLILDEGVAVASSASARKAATANVHALLAMLPLGLALADREGRFLFMNDAFCRAAGVSSADAPLHPSDLVVKEDKGSVSETVRRFASGRALPGDLAVRLKHRPDEPVALAIVGAKGLGDAVVLLSLRDDSEESKLKRQVAQATKMQAVGQLAGGVAHDFNNILTAIIGHCDLMMMRHTPGDIDYDDIQQIKHNSNRAASLTRQLLAFSRQQTLRPQILQIPEVISEISNLLKRLLGETVTLTVKHGRNLGLVRADPGQLEQVIVNLAVNARDAMPDGGELAIQTYPVSAEDVRRLGSDIMPVAEYTALSISDTGTGIPPDIVGKIFEPFFTTKEVGKGTGLGLSTVYGIVKQTDGFIFADSAMGKGTKFTIYLPVYDEEGASVGEPAPPVRVEASGEIWGSGTILLVEDEAMVRAVAERALARQGYHVLTAINGEEALELLRHGEPVDLLISDVVMPMMDGPTLVRHARDLFPDMPILFMSGYAEEQLRRSIDIDRVAFLPKPFSVQQLGSAARDVLAGKKS
jgi:two-component system cell cycle sensor histidine kinase/response regulator CckA